MNLNRVWVDGAATRSVQALDRGLQYGDGVFTTALVAQGRVIYLEDHVARLRRDAERLGIPPPSHWLLRAEFQTAAEGMQAAVVKYLLTRGAGERGYRPPDHPAPTRIMLRTARPAHPRHFWQRGIRLRLCRHRLSAQPRLAGLKHLNRLDQVLARGEWDRGEAEEGLLQGQDGALAGGTMSNLFLVRAGVLCTPDLDTAGVAGVMRARVLRSADKLAIPVHIARYTFADCLQADEVFVTNAVIGIWPVAVCETRRWSPCPGPVTLRLTADLRHPFPGADA